MQARRMLRRRDVLLRRGTGFVTSAGGRSPASRRSRGQRWLAERRRGPTAVAAGEGGPGDVSQEEEGGDVPEDEFLLEQIRGNSLNPNTPLGRAVADACEELEDLAKIEREVQDEAFALLEKLGMKRGPVEGEAAEGEAEDS